MAAAYQMEADKLKGYMSDRDKDQMKEEYCCSGSR